MKINKTPCDALNINVCSNCNVCKWVTTQINISKQYFRMVEFIVQYKVVLPYNARVCHDNLNESH